MAEQASGRNDPRFKQVADSQSYMGSDLARTYGFTRSEEAAALDQGMVDEQHAQLLRDGYIILENVVPEATIAALREASLPWLDKMGRNSFGVRNGCRSRATSG